VPPLTRKALVSVSNRTGLFELAEALTRHGFEIVSTGGTAQALTDAGTSVIPVGDLTGFPEVFGGRVKTLHPKVFGGILYERGAKSHVRQAEENGIGPIDLVAVNLYPFEETVASGASFQTAIEKIDIGGPSLLRAAAKNHATVTVLCDPADYPAAIAELDANDGRTTEEYRRRLAAKVFRRTAAYDAAIARWFTAEAGDGPFPEWLSLTFGLGAELRYGENPHQKGAFFVDGGAGHEALARFQKLQGKELSYNNLLDSDAALFTSRSVGDGTLTIVKHRIPSGVASAPTLSEAFANAWASDPVAGFGGVVAWTGRIDKAGAEALSGKFLEVVVAHDVDEDAAALLAGRPNLRVLTVGREAVPRARVEVRAIDGGLLAQEADVLTEDEATWKVVTKRAPTPDELVALRFAWKAIRGVVSNAIVVAKGTSTLGIGGGRTSRVDACQDAVTKATAGAGTSAKGASAASDAFFPFPDGLEVLAEAGITAVIQPGGSVKDAAVVEAADKAGIAMLFSGRRHFRH
jgi:phosphoribosylaminoimidazolecarboxamide formyltransferase/IMP cyclohydrolase